MAMATVSSGPGADPGLAAGGPGDLRAPIIGQGSPLEKAGRPVVLLQRRSWIALTRRFMSGVVMNLS